MDLVSFKNEHIRKMRKNFTESISNKLPGILKIVATAPNMPLLKLTHVSLYLAN